MSLKKTVWLLVSHLAAAAVGFALGIYLLPILTAPPSPAVTEVDAAARDALYSGEFRRDLADSDALHWGEGTVFIGERQISFQGALAPGPAYKLYLAPEFLETEADFLRLKTQMAPIGDVKTFERFVLPVPESVDPSAFSAVVIWCEAFDQFITAASYR